MILGIDAARVGGLAKRLATQAAMSATVMTGLHFAGGAGFSPADWLYGSDDRAVPVTSATMERLAAIPGQPVLGIAGKASADAGPPTGERIATADEPQERLAHVTRDRLGASDCHQNCDAIPTAKLAIPTPRPDYDRPRSVPPVVYISSERGTPDRIAVEPRQVAALIPAAPRGETAAGDAPELVRDETIPHPPEAENRQNRSFIAGVLPVAPMVVEEAGLLVRAAGGTVGAIADLTLWRLLP